MRTGNRKAKCAFAPVLGEIDVSDRQIVDGDDKKRDEYQKSARESLAHRPHLCCTTALRPFKRTANLRSAKAATISLHNPTKAAATHVRVIEERPLGGPHWL